MSLKNKIIFFLMLVGSGLFLYQGFSLLFNEEDKIIVVEDVKSKVKD